MVYIECRSQENNVRVVIAIGDFHLLCERCNSMNQNKYLHKIFPFHSNSYLKRSCDMRTRTKNLNPCNVFQLIKTIN